MLAPTQNSQIIFKFFFTLLPRFFFLGTILASAAFAFRADLTAPHFDEAPLLLPGSAEAGAACACPKGAPALCPYLS